MKSKYNEIISLKKSDQWFINHSRCIVMLSLKIQ